MLKPSRPLLAAGLLVAGAVLLAGCVTEPAPTPDPSSSISPNPDVTSNPDSDGNSDGEPGQDETPSYNVEEVRTQFTELAEQDEETVTQVPTNRITAPEKKNLNFGTAEPGPIPLTATVSGTEPDWLVDVKGWEVTDTLPGAGAAPEGQAYAVAYMDVALTRDNGILGPDLYFSLVTDDDGFYTLDDHPEQYDGNYMTVAWDKPGVKRGIVAAVLVPAGSTISSFALSLYGNGSLLVVDTDGVQR